MRVGNMDQVLGEDRVDTLTRHRNGITEEASVYWRSHDGWHVATAAQEGLVVTVLDPHENVFSGETSVIPWADAGWVAALDDGNRIVCDHPAFEVTADAHQTAEDLQEYRHHNNVFRGQAKSSAARTTNS